MTAKSVAVLTGGAIYIVSALLPLVKLDQWWIRVWDFPRLQFLVLGVLVFLDLCFRRELSGAVRWAYLAAIGLAIGFDLYRVLPYSPFHRVEVRAAGRREAESSLRVFIANVLQSNQEYSRLEELIRSSDPDVILLLEVDDRWMAALEPIKADYPHQIVHALDNEYGIALLSKLELVEPKVRFLFAPGIPSIVTELILRSGARVVLFGVHPEPPRPKTGESTERDAELVLVGKEAARTEKPVIVMGDLNDVAWSHTSRLFRRVSRLLDPRVGRGAFPTFPANVPLFRFPLDYVFHSEEFRLIELKRLPEFGSDHFPMVAELQLDEVGGASEGAAVNEEAPRPSGDDLEEAQKTIEEGRAK